MRRLLNRSFDEPHRAFVQLDLMFSLCFRLDYPKETASVSLLNPSVFDRQQIA
jgi:hypothetical protein